MILPERLIIRVYGILIDDTKGILVADEMEGGRRFTKFPGGGLELGEGVKDCLLREWNEELGQRIEIIDHFYTTDFFQESAFNPMDQLVSIYYRVAALDEPKTRISIVPFDFIEDTKPAASFRWISLGDFNEDLLTFPIDKWVGRMVGEKFRV